MQQKYVTVKIIIYLSLYRHYCVICAWSSGNHNVRGLPLSTATGTELMVVTLDRISVRIWKLAA